ncbi:MAG: sulfatase-like hydrolase/transferase, partial [Oscillospiraceae bacterium]|nr:sulfatase-like hydrolase/transferase [Oscillospiraceae bacterium]
YIGKWHLTGVPRDQYVPRERRFGFSEWKVNNCNHDYLNWNYYDEDNTLHPETTYEPVKLTDLALDFLRRNKEGPFALYLSWSTPHNPYFHMPQKYLEMYKDKPVTLRENVQDTMDMLHAEPFGEGYKLTTIEKDKNFIEEMYRGYYGHISALDEQFGRLADYLDENNLSENTIVVFTSDHGDMLGSHRFIDKQLPHEESARVPLIIGWKGKIIKGYLNEIASLADLPETLLSMMELSFGEKRDGSDLSPMLLEAKPGPGCAYIAGHVPCHNAAVRPYGAWRALRTADYMYAREADTDCTFLFEMKKDPYQKNNLKDDPKYKDEITRLKSQLDQKAKSYGDAVLDWREFLDVNGLVGEWDKSQQYFNLPLFESGKLSW